MENRAGARREHGAAFSRNQMEFNHGWHRGHGSVPIANLSQRFQAEDSSASWVATGSVFEEGDMGIRGIGEMPLPCISLIPYLLIRISRQDSNSIMRSIFGQEQSQGVQSAAQLWIGDLGDVRKALASGTRLIEGRYRGSRSIGATYRSDACLRAPRMPSMARSGSRSSASPSNSREPDPSRLPSAGEYVSHIVRISSRFAKYAATTRGSH